MEERRFHKNVSLSLLLHALIFALLFWYSQTASQRALEEAKKWVEITLAPPSKKNARIVDSTKGYETKEAAPDAYLGEKTRKVERETVAKLQPSAPPVPQAQPKPAQKNQPDRLAKKDETKPTQKSAKQVAKTQSRLKPLPLSKLGAPILPSFTQRELAREQEQATAPDFVPHNLGTPSVPQEYVQGIDTAGETALNTREYVFYSYFKRVRESLDRAWRPILREHIYKLYKRGRTIASNREHTTKTLVTLNDAGSIVRVQILEESGTRDLDKAAVQAFNRAGPFPNPPRGLIDQKGNIEIRWDFVLRT